MHGITAPPPIVAIHAGLDLDGIVGDSRLPGPPIEELALETESRLLVDRVLSCALQVFSHRNAIGDVSAVEHARTWTDPLNTIVRRAAPTSPLSIQGKLDLSGLPVLKKWLESIEETPLPDGETVVSLLFMLLVEHVQTMFSNLYPSERDYGLTRLKSVMKGLYGHGEVGSCLVADPPCQFIKAIFPHYVAWLSYGCAFTVQLARIQRDGTTKLLTPERRVPFCSTPFQWKVVEESLINVLWADQREAPLEDRFERLAELVHQWTGYLGLIGDVVDEVGYGRRATEAACSSTDKQSLLFQQVNGLMQRADRGEVPKEEVLRLMTTPFGQEHRDSLEARARSQLNLVTVRLGSVGAQGIAQFIQRLTGCLKPGVRDWYSELCPTTGELPPKPRPMIEQLDAIEKSVRRISDQEDFWRGVYSQLPTFFFFVNSDEASLAGQERLVRTSRGILGELHVLRDQLEAFRAFFRQQSVPTLDSASMSPSAAEAYQQIAYLGGMLLPVQLALRYLEEGIQSTTDYLESYSVLDPVQTALEQIARPRLMHELVDGDPVSIASWWKIDDASLMDLPLVGIISRLGEAEVHLAAEEQEQSGRLLQFAIAWTRWHIQLEEQIANCELDSREPLLALYRTWSRIWREMEENMPRETHGLGQLPFEEVSRGRRSPASPRSPADSPRSRRSTGSPSHLKGASRSTSSPSSPSMSKRGVDFGSSMHLFMMLMRDRTSVMMRLMEKLEHVRKADLFEWMATFCELLDEPLPYRADGAIYRGDRSCSGTLCQLGEWVDIALRVSEAWGAEEVDASFREAWASILDILLEAKSQWLDVMLKGAPKLCMSPEVEAGLRQFVNCRLPSLSQVESYSVAHHQVRAGQLAVLMIRMTAPVALEWLQGSREADVSRGWLDKQTSRVSTQSKRKASGSRTRTSGSTSSHMDEVLEEKEPKQVEASQKLVVDASRLGSPLAHDLSLSDLMLGELISTTIGKRPSGGVARQAMELWYGLRRLSVCQSLHQTWSASSDRKLAAPFIVRRLRMVSALILENILTGASARVREENSGHDLLERFDTAKPLLSETTLGQAGPKIRSLCSGHDSLRRAVGEGRYEPLNGDVDRAHKLSLDVMQAAECLWMEYCAESRDHPHGLRAYCVVAQQGHLELALPRRESVVTSYALPNWTLPDIESEKASPSKGNDRRAECGRRLQAAHQRYETWAALWNQDRSELLGLKPLLATELLEELSIMIEQLLLLIHMRSASRRGEELNWDEASCTVGHRLVQLGLRNGYGEHLKALQAAQAIIKQVSRYLTMPMATLEQSLVKELQRGWRTALSLSEVLNMDPQIAMPDQPSIIRSRLFQEYELSQDSTLEEVRSRIQSVWNHYQAHFVKKWVDVLGHTVSVLLNQVARSTEAAAASSKE